MFEYRTPLSTEKSVAWMNPASRASTISLPEHGDPYLAVFDLLWLNGQDLRSLPLIDRKKQLAAILPASPAFLFYVDHIEEKGRALFDAICAKDLEGIVAKPKRSAYDPTRTKWFKVKNPNYSQREGRREMFNSFMGYNDVA